MSRSLYRMALLCVLGTLTLLVGCGLTPATRYVTIMPEPPSTTVTIAESMFTPFILVVAPGTAVMWHNSDPVAHTVATTPESTAYLNTLTVNQSIPAGGMASITFSQPGLYHYYDPTVSDWNADFGRVAPRQGEPHFPMPMEGMIYVTGTISQLPAHAANSVIYLHDRIATNILAVRTGGTVSWHNYDTDPHFLLPVLGWDAPVNPVDIGINNLLGADAAPPDGETRTITFSTHGLYYYYCQTHAAVDPIYLRAVARQMASEYPIPMEGWVLVSGN